MAASFPKLVVSSGPLDGNNPNLMYTQTPPREGHYSLQTRDVDVTFSTNANDATRP